MPEGVTEFDTWRELTTVYHEGVPGHHLQLGSAIVDPDLNAWYDAAGAENADKCAWTFGTTSTATNGAKYNVTWGGTQFLIQQNWVAGTVQACAMSY